MKRLLDILLSVFGLLVSAPVILPVMFLVWRQDGASPFYIAPRVACGGGEFRMVKLRSMVKGADKSQVDSTSANDMRITKVGHFIRRYKLDEITQLWNVLRGDMSLVGPRPNVKREVDLYTAVEKHLLDVRPGITDFASIVFSDEGDILADKDDPDIAYNQLIRPWKSRLGLFYVDHSGVWLDLKLIVLTVVAIASRPSALHKVSGMLANMGAEPDLVRVAMRKDALTPQPPPGSDEVVSHR